MTLARFIPSAGPLRPALALLVALALGGCVSEIGPMGDTKPHPGVAKARQLSVHGIDISRYQGNIDWAAVKASGTRFAYIKATEGGDHIDPTFLSNWNGARAAGVPRGAYHFVYWCRPAHEQAQWFVQHIPNDRDALPPVLDLEWNGHSRTCPKKVEKQLALEKIRLMLRELEQHTGKRPIIYTDITFHRDVLEGEAEFDRYPFWLRSTAAEPHERYHARRWFLWQYTTTGRVPGIRGDVDRNVFYGSDGEWATFLSTDCDPRDLRHFGRNERCGGAPGQASQAYAPAEKQNAAPAAVAAGEAAPAAEATRATSQMPNAAPMLEPGFAAPPEPRNVEGDEPVPLDDPAVTSSLPKPSRARSLAVTAGEAPR